MWMKAKIVFAVLVFFASMTSAAAQATGGSPGGSTSTPGAVSPAAPNAGTRGLSPGVIAPETPGVADPRTGIPLPPNSGPRTPDASTYTHHPRTMQLPSPNQQRGVATDPERAQPGQARSRPGNAQSSNSDGYAECMSMWNRQTNRASREDWSKTCERTRLPQK
jgi:hypothetical protein